jgi:hypothetical protein
MDLLENSILPYFSGPSWGPVNTIGATETGPTFFRVLGPRSDK